MQEPAKIIEFQKQKVELYIKFEKRIISKAFEENNVPLSIRGIYMQMGLEIEETNSATFQSSYKTLIKKTGAAEDTLIKGLKLLKEKGFIHTHTQKGKTTSYTLLIGIYNGYKQSYPQVPLELGEVAPPKIGVPHVRVLKSSSRYKNKQQQAVVVDFKFVEGSIFRELDPDCLYEQSKKYGSERVQKVITRLEKEYTMLDQIKKSIEILFNKSVENPKFDFELPKKKRIREQRKDEAIKRAEKRQERARPIENKISSFPKFESVKNQAL